MQTLTKTLIGTVAAGAMAVSAATPALADTHNGGGDAGAIIAGALVLGGVAAIAASASKNHDRYDGRYDGHRGDRYGYGRYNVSSRDAVQQCVAAAKGAANRYRYGGRARVTDIRDVDRKGYGYKVEGRIAVGAMGRDRRGHDGRYGWGRSWRGHDTGTFKCKVDHRGRVMDLDFSGIRGL